MLNIQLLFWPDLLPSGSAYRVSLPYQIQAILSVDSKPAHISGIHADMKLVVHRITNIETSKTNIHYTAFLKGETGYVR